MNVDDLLQSRIDQVARAVEPPSPDTASIRRRGQQVRRRRRATVAAGLTVAAVAAGAFVGGGIVDRLPGDAVDQSAAAPDPFSGLPAWSDGQRIHVGDDVLDTPRGLRNLTLTADYVVYSNHAGEVYRQAASTPATVLADGALTGAVGDPNGRNAAWIDERSPNPMLVVMDVYTGQELRRIDLGPVEVTIRESITVSEPPPIVSVDADTVYYIANNHLWTYDYVEDSEPKPSPLDSDTLDDAVNGVLAVSDGSGAVEFRQPDGSVVRPTIQMEADGWLSSDGRLFLGFGVRAGGIIVADTETGQADLIDLHDKSVITGGWAYGNTVMLVDPETARPGGRPSSIPGGDVLACDATTLECQTVGSVNRFVEVITPSV